MDDTEPPPFEATYARTLGGVIRRRREALGWIRKELRIRLRDLPGIGVDISLQTLATYEQGTRMMSVVRLAQIAVALGISAEIITSEVNDVIFPARQDQTLALDLVKLAESTCPDIASIVKWAGLQLAGNPTKRIAELTIDALDQLSQVCVLDAAELVAVLREFTATRGSVMIELTEQQCRLLALVAAGKRDAEIAEEMGISIKTVGSYLERIRDKTGRRRRSELIRFAIQQGIAPPAVTDDPPTRP